MAEVVFADALRREGLADRVRVSSAGTGGWHVGSPADPRTAEALRRVEQRTERKARASATCLGGVARRALTTQRVAENIHLIHRRLC